MELDNIGGIRSSTVCRFIAATLFLFDIVRFFVVANNFEWIINLYTIYVFVSSESIKSIKILTLYLRFCFGGLCSAALDFLLTNIVVFVIPLGSRVALILSENL